MKTPPLSLLVISTALGTGAAQASAKGKELYCYFHGSQCHGGDGKVIGAQPCMTAIAGYVGSLAN